MNDIIIICIRYNRDPPNMASSTLVKEQNRNVTIPICKTDHFKNSFIIPAAERYNDYGSFSTFISKFLMYVKLFKLSFCCKIEIIILNRPSISKRSII